MLHLALVLPLKKILGVTTVWCYNCLEFIQNNRPKTKDLQSAKNELAAINVKLMGLDLEILLVPAPLLVAMLALITHRLVGVCAPC